MDRLNLVQSNQVKDWLLFTAFFTSDREKSLEIVQSFLLKPSTRYYVSHVMERININAYPKEVSIDIYTYFLMRDPNKEEIARAVKRSIDQFLQSEEGKQIVQKDAYTINIYSAEKKKIKIHY